MSKLPAIQFFTADWLKDPELRVCTSASRGVWIDCLCVMSESQERGVLRLKNGNAVTPHQLAGLIGVSVTVVKKALNELEANGVFSRTSDGAIFSKRMVEDEKRRQQLKTNGEFGGRPKGQPDSNHNQNQTGGQHSNQAPNQTETKPVTKTRTKTEPEANQDPNQNGGSSSSSAIAFSTSENNQTPNQDAGGGATKPPAIEPIPKPSRQPEPRPKPKPKPAAKADPESDPRFREFWSAYPRKVQETKAAGIYATIDPLPELQAEILAAIADQKTWPKWAKDDGEYIPYPANWLENRQWRDKPPEVLIPGPDDVPSNVDPYAELKQMAASMGYSVETPGANP